MLTQAKYNRRMKNRVHKRKPFKIVPFNYMSQDLKDYYAFKKECMQKNKSLIDKKDNQ